MSDRSSGTGARDNARRTPWHRSLYWRIGLGLCAFLALMLAAEAALFLWVASRMAGSMPARDPRRLAVLVASDLGAAFEDNPDLDLARYLREQYGHVLQTFVVVLRDGRMAANHDDVRQEVLEAVLAEQDLGPPRGRGGRLLPARPGGAAPPFRAGRAPIRSGGALWGRVVVLSDQPPFARLVRQFGPALGLAAAGVLVVGIALIALVVFRPVQRRLREVQSATERLRAGDLTARAREDGGDEVAALARSFNRMADDLAARARALEAADAARRQLLADVSHELMTPLTAMRGYLETLAMTELALDEATRERYLHVVSEETHRLERIIGDLLDLARLEGGGAELRRTPVDVAALFERVAARHERELTRRGVRLARVVEAGAEHVTGDADRLEQALQNLAANALRYVPDGGEISLRARRLDGAVQIVVRDNGPGIPPEHLPLVFERFYKGDTARRAAGGSGLGLSIVKAVVERHGGRVSVRNDGGAVFEMELPLEGGRQAPDSRHPTASASVTGPLPPTAYRLPPAT